jgi:hypothetical protein
MKDVTLFAVSVEQESQPCITVGVVFYCCYFGWDVVFVAAKVNDAVEAFVSTTTTTTGNYAAIVAAFWPMI